MIDNVDNLDSQSYLSVLGIKIKKVKEEIDGIKAVLETVPNNEDGVYFKNLINKLELMVNEGNLFLREKIEDSQIKGKTGYFDKAQIDAMIQATQSSVSGNSIIENSIIQEGTYNKEQDSYKKENMAPPQNIMPKEKLRLKPVGELYSKNGQQISLANNKIDGTLYIASMSEKRVLVRPQGIEEIFTDELKNRVLAVGTISSNGDKFFIDTLNKKIVSGPISGIKEIVFVQRYHKVLLAQVIMDDGKKTFLDIDLGKMISEQDIYQYLT